MTARLWHSILLADMARINALEAYLVSRQWKRSDPEPRRLERLLAGERARMAEHLKAATDQERLPQ